MPCVLLRFVALPVTCKGRLTARSQAGYSILWCTVSLILTLSRDHPAHRPVLGMAFDVVGLGLNWALAVLMLCGVFAVDSDWKAEALQGAAGGGLMMLRGYVGFRA